MRMGTFEDKRSRNDMFDVMPLLKKVGVAGDTDPLEKLANDENELRFRKAAESKLWHLLTPPASA